MREVLNAKREKWERRRLGRSGASARYAAVAVLGAFLMGLTACGGPLVLPAWLNLDPSQSTLQIQAAGIDFGSSQLQGGIYAVISLDLSHIPTVTGTIQVPRIEIATQNPYLGPICVAADSSNPQVGHLSLNVLTGASQVDFPLATQTTALRKTVASQSDITNVSFPLDISLLNGLLKSGEVDGLIQLPLSVQQDFQLGGLSASATISGVVTSSSVPPAVSTELTACQSSAAYAQQTSPVAVVVNSKRTYLRTFWDNAMGARVVSLAQLGAQPGDTLSLSPAGSFASTTGEPGSSRIVAAFSSSDTLLGNPSFFGSASRLPGALNAGVDITTPRSYYFRLPTDISQDFEVKPNTEVVVPTGATHLFFTPYDSHFDDNFSTDLRVQIQVNPQS